MGFFSLKKKYVLCFTLKGSRHTEKTNAWQTVLHDKSCWNTLLWLEASALQAVQFAILPPNLGLCRALSTSPLNNLFTTLRTEYILLTSLSKSGNVFYIRSQWPMVIKKKKYSRILSSGVKRDILRYHISCFMITGWLYQFQTS